MNWIHLILAQTALAGAKLRAGAAAAAGVRRPGVRRPGGRRPGGRRPGGRRPGGLSPGAYLGVQAAVVLAVAGLLGWFSPLLVRPESLPRVGPLSDPGGFAARTFCAWAFLLAWGCVRLAAWAARLIFAGDDGEFAALRRDWEEALRQLDRAGLSVREAPLFLTVGLSRAEEPRFFAAAGREWTVAAPAPADADAVLRVYADPDGVYVACRGVGAAAAQRGLKATPADGLGGPGAGGPGAPPGGDGSPPASPPPAPPSAPPANPPARVAVPPLDAPGRRAALRQTAYLCERIARERGDLCPANGALAAVPLIWSDPLGPDAFPSNAAGGGSAGGGAAAVAGGAAGLPKAIADDLSAAAAVWGQSFPACVAFTGLERLRGAEELIARGERLAPGFADSRAGTRFPAGRDLDPQTAAWAVGKLRGWVVGWTDRALAESLPVGPADPAVDRNGQLVRLVSDVRRRAETLTAQLGAALATGEHGAAPPRLAGVYCCGTGSGGGGAAFVAGVLRRLEDVQDWVAWLPERLARDRRRTTAAYLLLALAVALLIAAALAGRALLA